MVSKVTAWRTADGRLWPSGEEADLHELLLKVEEHLKASGLQPQTWATARYGLEILLKTGKFTLTYNESADNGQAPAR